MQIDRDPQALDQATKWSVVEGWEPGLEDAKAFAEVDGGGWFSARSNDGVIVTTLSALKYDDSFGFIGLYITQPEYRGQGIGSQVWQLGREHLVGCDRVGLDGVLEREDTYASDGFVRSHVTTRYSGAAGVLASTLTLRAGELSSEFRFIDACEVGAQRLGQFELDHELFPAPRERFLATLIDAKDSTSLAVVSADNELRGWGMVRPSVTGWRVGPLFALSSDVAVALLRGLAAAVPGEDTIYIDIPDPNEVAIALVRTASFKPIFGCVRMYAGAIPDLDLSRIYANTTFELG